MVLEKTKDKKSTLKRVKNENKNFKNVSVQAKH